MKVFVVMKKTKKEKEYKVDKIYPTLEDAEIRESRLYQGEGRFKCGQGNWESSNLSTYIIKSTLRGKV